MQIPTKITRHISLLLAGTVLLSSCMSSTVIRSNPSGAKVYIDGQARGTTPYRHADTKIIGSTTAVRLEKEGYETLYTMFSRTEQPDIGAIVGGFFIWIPLLWAMKYDMEHVYELTPYNPQQDVQQQQQNEKEQTQAPFTPSKANQLRELKKLLDEKVITQEEFEKEKKKILDE